MAKTFRQAFNDSRKKHPNDPTYLHLCRVVGESGMSGGEIKRVFDLYMPPVEFDKEERQEMVDYLIKISNYVED